MLSPTRSSRPSPAVSPSRRPPIPPSPPSQLLVPATQHPIDPEHCLSIPLRFTVSQHTLQVSGYQMYAVEKWMVERNRPVTVLLVYTGDPSHMVSVFALSPLPELSPTEAQAEWDKALTHLRRDGARSKETPHGVLMATSLAHFRSDYTIVLIPDGNFLAVREQLYANITLLRMGCSGRSALTLEDPSDATKSRFVSTYHFPDSICAHTGPALTSTENLALPSPIAKTRSHSHSNSNSVINFAKYPPPEPSSPPASFSKGKALGLGFPSTFKDRPRADRDRDRDRDRTDNALFTATVLELVKLLQAGLALFSMYGGSKKRQHPLRLDGLLCDETVEGIRRWIVEIGQPCVGLEPMERIADPMFVSALISLVLCVRNKLAAIGFSQLVPKDPFLHPHLFSIALSAYITSTNPGASNPTIASSSTASPSQPPPHEVPSFLTSYALPSPGAGGTHTMTFTPPHRPHHAHAHLLTPSSSTSSGSGAPAAQAPLPVLTRELVDAISLAYDAKGGAADGGRRVRRALRDKLRAGIDSEGELAGEPRGVGSGGEGGSGSVGIVAGHGGQGGIGIGIGKDRDGGKETIGGVGTGVGSSGGQILSGIGSFASGLGIGVGPGGAAGAGAVVEATCDIGWFVRAVYAKDKEGDRGGKGKGRKGRAEGPAGYREDGGVGVSVRALWSGQVGSLIRLREWEVEKERMGNVAERKRRGAGAERERLALSDGDVDDSAGAMAKSETEEESDSVMQQGSFRGMWGERMQKKLGSWAGGENAPSVSTPGMDARPDMLRGQSMPMSPILPPIVFSLADPDPDDDDLLSSGQVSPIDGLRRNPFTLFQDGPSMESTSLTNTEYERKVTEFNQKRPWGTRMPQHRISSWADPFSARELLDDERSSTVSRRRKRGNTIGSLLGGASVLSEVMSEDWEDLDGVESAGEYEGLVKRRETPGPQRRRSFHDIASLRNMRIIPVEHMRVDVELSGQLLIMARREQHLQNVVSCLQVLTRTLSTTNTHLREDYTAHIPFIAELDAHAQVISGIDAENAKADKTSQATNTLRYEAEQFRVPDLWHIATPSRQEVLALREKVFGTGGRRLPAGVHGAHGRFNRLQWTLDGRERLVDYLGRTESEAEEEEPGVPYLGTQDESDEEDVVQHTGMKPMWLLRFFTSWGARWGASDAPPDTQPLEETGQETPQEMPSTKGNEKMNGNGHLRVRANGKGSKKLTFALPPETEDEYLTPGSPASMTSS
ncbi:hypothetical protein DXG01_006301 [Tephrocybe rancida]|nr:hypothetical protein DXG01_006301 [Tephrocybe rancida]